MQYIRQRFLLRAAKAAGDLRFAGDQVLITQRRKWRVAVIARNYRAIDAHRARHTTGARKWSAGASQRSLFEQWLSRGQARPLAVGCQQGVIASAPEMVRYRLAASPRKRAPRPLRIRSRKVQPGTVQGFAVWCGSKTVDRKQPVEDRLPIGIGYGRQRWIVDGEWPDATLDSALVSGSRGIYGRQAVREPVVHVQNVPRILPVRKIVDAAVAHSHELLGSSQSGSDLGHHGDRRKQPAAVIRVPVGVVLRLFRKRAPGAGGAIRSRTGRRR